MLDNNNDDDDDEDDGYRYKLGVKRKQVAGKKLDDNVHAYTHTYKCIYIGRYMYIRILGECL